MKYYHYYDPMKGNDLKCTVSLLTQNGDWAIIESLGIPNVPDRQDDDSEDKVITMLKDFIKAIDQ